MTNTDKNEPTVEIENDKIEAVEVKAGKTEEKVADAHVEATETHKEVAEIHEEAVAAKENK